MSIGKPILSFGNNLHLPIIINDTVYSISSGISVNSEDIPVVNNIDFGILKTSCVSNGFFMPNKNKKVLPFECVRVKQSVEVGSLIISRMNTPLLVGEVAYISKSYCNLFLPDRLWSVRTKNSYDPYWLASYLITPKIKFRLKELATGTSGSMKNISQSSFMSIKLCAPKLQEQQKIASFLTSVDSKISQLTENHRLLKEYKKGVMQQIFSQQLRFKDEDGNAFPEWKFVPLNELANKQSQKNRDKTVKEVLTNSAKHGVLLQSSYFDKEIAKEDNTDNYHVVDVDDFVYNPRISVLAPVGPIGRNKVIRGVMSPLYSVFRFNNLVELDFIEHFFNGATWYKYMHSVANFGARHDRMNISSSDLMSLPCPYPCLEEQQKITQFLQSIDIRVNAVVQQVEQTKQFKKGLLQQMFV